MGENMPEQKNLLYELKDEAKDHLDKGMLSKDEFVTLAQKAIDVYRQNPEARQEIAYSMTGLWGRFDNLQEDESTHEIGGEFADLELPDHHVDLGDHTSVEDKWNSLAQKIEALANENNKWAV